MDVSYRPKFFAIHELLLALIAATPVLALGGEWVLGPQLITLATAILLALLPNGPDVDVKSSLAVFRPLAPVAMLPAAWMLLQIAPVPLGSIEHPIWRSAAEALSQSMLGHISIDPGFTLRALFRYLTLAALAFSTAVVARNRDRAETLLFALCTVTTFVGLEVMLLPHLARTEPLDDLVAPVVLGMILDAALFVRAAERYETRVQAQTGSQRAHAVMLIAGLAGVLICTAALIQSATYGVRIAALFGLAVFLLVILIRRLGLGRWTAVTVSAAVFVACCSVIVFQFPSNASANSLFRFTRLELTDASAATLRMLSDTGWAGVGVGNYGVFGAIYRDPAGGVADQASVNLVAAMLVEWGYAGALIVALPLFQQVIVLLRGAMSRGRDAFFAASAAACLVTIFCEAFCDGSATAIAVQMLAAIIVGMGMSQTVGSRAR